MKVRILGTEYEIIKDDSGTNPKFSKCNAYTDFYSKKIVLDQQKKDDIMNVENIPDVYAEVLRHEIVHAFLFESGLSSCSDWGEDETLVDWIALQLPKIVDVMIGTGSLRLVRSDPFEDDVFTEEMGTLITGPTTIVKVPLA
jgi:hypothetical protein